MLKQIASCFFASHITVQNYSFFKNNREKSSCEGRVSRPTFQGMSGYDKEYWVELYRAALVELEHAKMAGRIGDARTEIAARIEKLRTLPGLHAAEQQALQDALSGLRSLEREDAEYEAAAERRIAEAALDNLRIIAPRLDEL